MLSPTKATIITDIVNKIGEVGRATAHVS
jgi:hypothetical protein